MQQHKEWFHELMDEIEASSPLFAGKRGKISSGENLQLMPWMVADFPVIQQKDFEYVCRTLFWWGHYYSLNIIIRRDLIKANKINFSEPVWLENSGDIWNNDISNGYIQTTEIDTSNKEGYLRIAMVFPIEERMVDVRKYLTLLENLK